MAANELRDYLEMGRYKDGLNKCNKFLKKSPSDNKLLYFKASFLFGLTQNEEGNRILDQLCSRDPPITDLNFIVMLDELATTSVMDQFPRPLSNGSRAGKLWSNATNAAGRNGVIAINRRRLTNAVNEQRWQDAGSALIALKKADPSNKHWKLAHIAMQQLLSEADKDEKIAGMNRILAFRTLKQSTIEDPAQLRLLINVYRRQGQNKEVLDTLEAVQAQEDGTLAKQVRKDWPFTRQKIELCIKESRWQDLHTLCSSLLGEDLEESAQTSEATENTLRIRDDWAVWDGLVRASAKLQKSTEVPSYNTERGDDSRIKRLQMIASLQAVFLSEEGKDSFEGTLKSAKDFFSEWQTYPFCYGDIKDFVEKLPADAQADFLQHLSQSSKRLAKEDSEKQQAKGSEWLTAEINALKFEYRLNIGITKPDPEVIRSFACSCIRLMENCSKKKLRLADACYLAVSSLIRLYELENDVTYLFQAAYLLETGPAVEDAHPGKVLLIYLETEIGLHSMAIKQYESLRVREIQQETMSHSLLTRISINHPFPLEQKRGASSDPFDIIDNALDMFIFTDQKLSSSQTMLMEKGQCDLVFELQDLRDTLARSYTRRMLILEQCRVARLTDIPLHPRSTDIRPSVHEYWTQNLKDSRDYAETFNYDGVATESTPERRLQSGGKIPDNTWLHNAIVSEDIWSLLLGRTTVRSKPITASPPPNTPSEGLTTMESHLYTPWSNLLTATQTLLSTTPKTDLSTFETLLQSLQDLPIQNVCSTQTPPGLPPQSHALQSYFLLFDYLRSTALLLNTSLDIQKKKRQGTVIPASIAQNLRETVTKAFAQLQQHAQQQKKKVDGRDMVQGLRRGKVGDVISEAEGLGQGVRAFATRAEEAVVDAWDGVLKVKLGLK